jgi:hypothetical protein
MEPAVFLTLTAIVAAIVWHFAQIRGLERRLASLEKQHMALVADLEERLYGDS